MRFLLVGALALAGCGPVIGNGQLTTDARSETGYTIVENDSEVAVRVFPGAFSQSVVVDDNLVPLIKTEVRDGALRILSSSPVRASTDAGIDVHLPDVAAIRNAGTGSITAFGFSGLASVTVESHGSGSVDWSGSAQAMTVSSSGSGPVRLLSGALASSITVSSSGEGGVDAQSFPATNATLSNSGSGEVIATVRGGALQISATGSGNVTWYGTATSPNITDTGSGMVVHGGE